MLHDGGPAHVAAGCYKMGIMTTGQGPFQWSTCSRADFEAHFLQYKDTWCFPGNNTFLN